MIKLSYPKQTMIVSCRHEDKDNLITIDWHMPTSFNPALYLISVGVKRHSLEMIRDSKVFCVNFLSENMGEKALICGTKTGRLSDKFKEAELTKVECENIDCGYISEAQAVFECEVVDELETGDHVLFIGKILKSHDLGSEKRLFNIGTREFTTTR